MMSNIHTLEYNASSKQGRSEVLAVRSCSAGDHNNLSVSIFVNLLRWPRLYRKA